MGPLSGDAKFMELLEKVKSANRFVFYPPEGEVKKAKRTLTAKIKKSRWRDQRLVFGEVNEDGELDGRVIVLHPGN